MVGVRGTDPAVVLDAGSADGGGLVVPGGEFLLHAEYVREGPDLALVGSNGDQVLVVDFFAVAEPPALVSDSGLRILPQVAAKLAGPMAPGQYAQAAPGVAGEPVARVETIDGEAFAVRADGTRVALTAGSSIFQGDVLETGPGAAVGLIYIDGMTMALDENTRMVVDQVFYNPTAGLGKALFSLVEGAFLSLSGEIAKLGDDVVQIQTPTGNIGIRGTNQATSHIGSTQVVLLPNPDGTVSALIFFNDGGFVILDEPFEGLRSTSFDVAPSQPTIFASMEAALASLGISPKAAGTYDETIAQALLQKAEILEQGLVPEAGAPSGDAPGDPPDQGESTNQSFTQSSDLSGGFGDPILVGGGDSLDGGGGSTEPVSENQTDDFISVLPIINQPPPEEAPPPDDGGGDGGDGGGKFLQSTDATSGAAFLATFTLFNVSQGDILSFDYIFFTNEVTPSFFNDFAFVTVGGQLAALADTNSDFVPSDSDFVEETAVLTFDFVIAAASAELVLFVGVGVIDVGDQVVDSALLFFEFTLNGEPIDAQFNFFTTGDVTFLEGGEIQLTTIGFAEDGATSDAALEDFLALPAGTLDDLAALIAAAGDPIYFGGAGNDTLEAGPENDLLLGLGGGDTLIGGDGDDILKGGPGADMLTGGAGSDIFAFAEGDGSPTVAQANVITDFQIETDLIQLDGGLTFDDLTLSEVDAVGTDAIDTVISVTATGEFLAVVDGVTGLSAFDFVPPVEA